MSMDGVLRLYFGESNLPTPDYIKQAAIRALDDGFTFYTENAGLALAAPRHRRSLPPPARRRARPRRARSSSPPRACRRSTSPSAARSIPATKPSCSRPPGPTAPRASSWPTLRPRHVPLALCGDRYRIDFDALEAALTPRTRLLIYTSPSNPLGWVATRRAAAPARVRPPPRSLAARRRSLRPPLLRRPRARRSRALDSAQRHARRRRHRGPVLLQELLHDRLARRLAGRPRRPRRQSHPVERVHRLPRPQLRPESRRDRPRRRRARIAPHARTLQGQSRPLPRRPSAACPGVYRPLPRWRLLPLPEHRRPRRLLRVLPPPARRNPRRPRSRRRPSAPAAKAPSASATPPSRPSWNPPWNAYPTSSAPAPDPTQPELRSSTSATLDIHGLMKMRAGQWGGPPGLPSCLIRASHNRARHRNEPRP